MGLWRHFYVLPQVHERLTLPCGAFNGALLATSWVSAPLELLNGQALPTSSRTLSIMLYPLFSNWELPIVGMDANLSRLASSL